jgi:hypothetical protein
MNARSFSADFRFGRFSRKRRVALYSPIERTFEPRPLASSDSQWHMLCQLGVSEKCMQSVDDRVMGTAAAFDKAMFVLLTSRRQMSA